MLFTVKPAAAATSISNQAAITFDGSSQSTPLWSNAVDETPPSSSVNALSSPIPDQTFPVSWSGSGAGLKDYTIYVSEDGGPYTAWKQNTILTSDTFVPTPKGHGYAFYSRAQDVNGNMEAAPPGPDAQTNSTTAVGEAIAWRLGLEGAVPNPARGALRVAFTLASGERAVLEVVDVAGRWVARREVGSLGPGRHVVELGSPGLKAGLYFLRLEQGGQVLRSRVVVMR